MQVQNNDVISAACWWHSVTCLVLLWKIIFRCKAVGQTKVNFNIKQLFWTFIQSRHKSHGHYNDMCRWFIQEISHFYLGWNPFKNHSSYFLWNWHEIVFQGERQTLIIGIWLFWLAGWLSRRLILRGQTTSFTNQRFKRA